MFFSPHLFVPKDIPFRLCIPQSLLVQFLGFYPMLWISDVLAFMKKVIVTVITKLTFPP